MGRSRGKSLLSASALALVACAFFAGPASADSGSITGIQDIGSSKLRATFSATHTDCQETYYCGFFPIATVTPGGGSCTAWDSLIWVGPVLSAAGTVSETHDFFPGFTGALTFCVWNQVSGTYVLVAQSTYFYNPVAPVPGGTAPPQPASPVHLERVPKSVAHQVDRYHFGSFRLNSDYLPPGVDEVTFTRLANRTNDRWGLSVDGSTYATPGDYDGTNSVGFSYSLPDGVLGLTTEFRKRYYGRGKRRCHKVRRGGRLVKKCKRGKRRVTGTRVLEEDTEFDALSPWSVGPGYPAASQFDLETVMIHEFGHFAGNGHVHGCRNSPMIVAIETGEWWHGVSDWKRYGCAAASARRRPEGRNSARTRRGRLITRTVFVDARSNSRQR